jgi:hypothetical protein
MVCAYATGLHPSKKTRWSPGFRHAPGTIVFHIHQSPYRIDPPYKVT